MGTTSNHNHQIDGWSTRTKAKKMLKCKEVINSGQGHVELDLKITNDQRTFGATLSNAISLQFGDAGLPENTINLNLEGSAGQSFCAFLAKGVTVQLKGDANDYVGKCLSGGRVSVNISI